MKICIYAYLNTNVFRNENRRCSTETTFAMTHRNVKVTQKKPGGEKGEGKVQLGGGGKGEVNTWSATPQHYISNTTSTRFNYFIWCFLIGLLLWYCDQVIIRNCGWANGMYQAIRGTVNRVIGRSSLDSVADWIVANWSIDAIKIDAINREKRFPGRLWINEAVIKDRSRWCYRSLKWVADYLS